MYGFFPGRYASFDMNCEEDVNDENEHEIATEQAEKQ